MARRLLFVVLALFAATAWGAGMTVSGAWIRHLPAGVPAGGFFTLNNEGEQTALVGASSPDYGMVMMHKTIEEGGVSKMVHVDKVDVPAAGQLSFRPGSYHLMFMQPTRDIAVGSKVPVTLEFSDGRKLTVPFEVRGPTAR